MKPTELFTRIETLLPELQGWCSQDKAAALAAAVLALRPKVAVEIGVFGGSSFLPTALAMEACDCGHLTGIDPWSPDASTDGYVGENEAFWRAVDHEAVMQKFLGHVRELGLEQRVTIERKRSDDARPPKVIDLLHVDGQHTDQAVRDVKRFASKVRVGGLVCMDDINWTGGGVARGVEALLKFGFVEIYRIGEGAMFQRVK